MHTADIRHRFVGLRAQGWSLARIAAELHLSKSTVVEWNRTARQEIHDLKSLELEALQERVLVSHEVELQRLTAQLNRIEEVLAQRNLACLSTESLFVLAATVRAQLRRLTSVPVLKTASAAGPAGENPSSPDESDVPVAHSANSVNSVSSSRPVTAAMAAPAEVAP